MDNVDNVDNAEYMASLLFRDKPPVTCCLSVCRGEQPQFKLTSVTVSLNTQARVMVHIQASVGEGSKVHLLVLANWIKLGLSLSPQCGSGKD